MESRDRVEEEVTAAPSTDGSDAPPSLDRLRLAAWSLVLTAVAFVQAPGRTVTDTKLDLTVDPWGFMGRALDLWDPLGAFGQVQNQAYGYLFPMGPFFALLDGVQVPDWVVQRLWWALVLVVAFLGVVKLCSVLDIGVGWTRIAAGLAFALSPRLMTVLGPASIEVWPSALAPWVLVPLVIGLQRRDPRRMAALSALAVACVGGVNAAATFAVVPLGAVLLLLAAPGDRRRSLMLWWPGFVALGTLWWLFPLVLLGRFSPPFLDYIESAETTTFAATALDALRGTSNWVAYIDPDSVAGRQLLSDPVVVANGVVVLGLGVLGIAWSRGAMRSFLLTGLLLGLLMVTAGHVGASSGWGAQTIRDLLDGPLAPLRNTHKFDVVIRLPLVLGFCIALTALTRRRAAEGVIDVPRAGAVTLAIAALIGATSPAWNASIANRGSFESVPDYWAQTSTWLAEEGKGRALLTPATPFGDYLWGKTADEPLQPLASSPWGVRNLIPLAPGGNIEYLDALSSRFSTGRGSTALTAAMRRGGIGTIVVRHDIDRTQNVVSPELVRSTLATSPGVRLVASFGPQVGGGPTLENDEGTAVFIDSGWQSPRPAVEVFELDGAVPDRSSQSEDLTPVMIGDPESQIALDELLGSDQRSVVMAKDAQRSVSYGSAILTDGARRQEAGFGSVDRNRSGSLTTSEPWATDRPVHRYDEAALQGWTTTPQLRGAVAMSSSSSRSQIGSLPRVDQSAQTWAAFDGDPTTVWRPDLADDAARPWVSLDLGRDRLVGTLSIDLGHPVGETRVISVLTEQGPRTVRVPGGSPVEVNVGRVSEIRVSGRSTISSPLSIRDITASRVEVSRPLVLPKMPPAWGAPQTILLHSGPGFTDGCLTLDEVLRCSPTELRRGDGGRDLDREVQLSDGGSYELAVRSVAGGGPALDRLVQQGRFVTVSASSQETAAANGSPLRVLDGNDQTAWIASEDDLQPTLTVSFLRDQRMSRIDLQTDDQIAASTPERVRLEFSDGTVRTAPVRDGVVEFRPVRADQVDITVVESSRRTSVDFKGVLRALPVGISEVNIDGVEGLRLTPSGLPQEFACGTGPTVTVGGQTVRTALEASPRDLLDGRPVSSTVCGRGQTDLEVELGSGVTRIRATGTDAVRADSLVLQATDEISSPPGDGVLEVRTHNTNDGWVATRDGASLESVVVNGWQQAWVDPSPEQGAPKTSFAPSGEYVAALLVGMLLLLALVLRCALPDHAQRSALPPTGDRSRRLGLGVAGVGLVGLLVAGLPGLAGCLLGVLAATQSRRATAAVLAAASIVAAGLFFVILPWGSPAGWAGTWWGPQVLVTLGLGLLVGSGVRRPMSLSLRKGFSTRR